MDSNAIRKELDVIIAETTDYDDSVLPDGLIENGVVMAGFRL